ncbi:MAG: transcription antitermination protein NusB [Crocinitomicaceae bacterium]|jgi:N utilization substance protein B|nr:transcription antitermination protein NusB [Crocinitomicaceae bacterium]
MLNRRHLRIKVLQSLYSFFQGDEDDFKRTESELMSAIDKIYDLYIYFLLSFGELNRQAINRQEENKKKLRPTEEDLNPNMRFVNNRIIAGIEAMKELEEVAEERKINWVGAEEQEMFRKIFMQMREGENFFAYMNADEDNFEADRQFVLTLFKEEIANSPLIYHFFEEKSIHWLDDIDLVCSMVLKTIKNFEEDSFTIMPLYKDKEDEMTFIKELYRKTLTMDKENEALIDDLTKNWELDRIAKMDIILMKMALTEMQIFKSIPTKVTLNEYIEISKYYSTPKSNGFINGILDKAIAQLTKENKITKMGRGLIND